jgi:hypothetical protein
VGFCYCGGFRDLLFAFLPLVLSLWGLFHSGGYIMYNTKKKRYYSPQFSETACVSVRRLAWAFGVSMPKAVDIIINELSSAFSSSVICPQCKDKTKCNVCGFCRQTASAV